MRLRGQAGYAMAVLLVAMSVMAVMLTMAMPVWRQAAQREKEEELVFRGMQYAHAIGLFQRKYANAYPPSLDVLVNERMLRRKFKDPITNDDFAPILAGQSAGTPQQPGRGGRSGPSGALGPTGGRGTSGATQMGRGALDQMAIQIGGVAQGAVGPGQGVGRGGGPVGGIMGVTSKSKEKSIRLYKGRNHYNEWQFVYVQQVQAPGAGAPGVPPGQRGQPGQRGNVPNPFGPGTGPRGNPPGRGGPTAPGGRGSGPGTFNPFQPVNPQQPIGAPRGRG